MFKRFLFFTYGLAAYLVFLGTFLYAIAFVGGFLVPTRLDGPLQASWPVAVAIDGLLLTVFAVQHSVMARRWFKERWTQIVPWAIERSTFVLGASLALLLLFWQWRPIGVQIWSIENPIARVVVWTAFAAGWATVLITTFLINHFDLFGLRQVWLPLTGRPYRKVEFRTPLPYRYVRHPLYLGFLLAFWMTPTMTVAHLLFALITTAYIVVAIQLEEKDLLYEHGAAYQEYRRAVPMLLPNGRGLGANGLRAGKTGAASAIGLLVVLSGVPDSIVSAKQHSHTTDASALVAVVREATERFKDVAAAEAAGFELQFGCVSGPDWGAMGLHYVHFPRVLDGDLDARQPEIVIYEPLPNGTQRLIGADYLVLADAWHKNHANPPQLMGQLLHLIEAPNRFGLPTFYTLHVWAWKDNPGGTFANWHKNVSCDSFGGDSTQ